MRRVRAVRTPEFHPIPYLLPEQSRIHHHPSKYRHDVAIRANLPLLTYTMPRLSNRLLIQIILCICDAIPASNTESCLALFQVANTNRIKFDGQWSDSSMSELFGFISLNYVVSSWRCAFRL